VVNPLNLKNLFPDEKENNVEVDFSQPPIYDLSDGEELDEIDEQMIEFEKSCEEVEALKKRRTKVEYALSRSLEASLPRLSSSP